MGRGGGLKGREDEALSALGAMSAPDLERDERRSASGLGPPAARPSHWPAVPLGLKSHLFHTSWFLNTRQLLHLELNHTEENLYLQTFIYLFFCI